jgi:hypothetical protein
LAQGIVVDVGGLREFAMPSANNVHREFDYSFLSQKSHRRTWRAFAFIVFGSIAAASGIVLQMPGQELDTDGGSGGSVIAAAPLNPSATPVTIVSPAAPVASAPDSRHDTASPPTSAQAAPVDAITAVATEPAATAATEPAVTAATEPAVTAATEPAVTESPPQSVAAAKKPQKTSAAKKPKKTARQNHPDWYDAYAWRQQNADYWRGRGSYHHQARPFW